MEVSPYLQLADVRKEVAECSVVNAHVLLVNFDLASGKVAVDGELQPVGLDDGVASVSDPCVDTSLLSSDEGESRYLEGSCIGVSGGGSPQGSEGLAIGNQRVSPTVEDKKALSGVGLVGVVEHFASGHRLGGPVGGVHQERGQDA